MVKRGNIIFIVIMAYLFINMFVSSCLCMSNNEYIAYAIDYNNDIIKNDNYELGIDSNYVLNSNQVDVPIILHSNYNIEDYLVEDTDFIIKEGKKDGTNKLLFTLECPSYGYYELNVIVKLTNNNRLYVHIYAICNDFGVFISKESFDHSLDNIIDYFISNNIIMTEEIDEIRDEYLYKKELNNKSDRTLEDNNINKKTENNTRSGDSKAHGTLTWIDNNGNGHALRKVKVELRDSDLIGSQLLGTTYTDDVGEYSVWFTNDSSILENGGCDLFIRVFAGDDNAYVVESNGTTKYSVETSHTANQNVPTGCDKIISEQFEMTSNSKKALQISQALLTARDFAKAMKGTNPHSVVVRYPYGDMDEDGCYYQSEYDMITICGDERMNDTVPWPYASWDVIMHEYGHHIAHYEGIDASPGGRHWGNVDMIDHYLGDDINNCGNECAAHRSTNPININNAKEAGLKLVWSEAWATAFAFVAQEHYSSMNGNISGVCNEMYDAYNIDESYDFHFYAYRTRYAETEDKIYTILWDLFDTNNDSNDRLSLSYQEWWSITTGYHAYTFSDFMEDFYNQYPNYIGEIGYNLEYYNIAPTLFVNENNIVELKPGMTSFNIMYGLNQNATQSYKIDRFYVTIFSEDYSESYTTPLLSGDTYSISAITFNYIKEFKKDTVHIFFKGIQSGLAPNHPEIPQTITSGPYYSHCITVPKRCFKTTITNNQTTITGAYYDLSGIVNIPSTIDGYPVTSIGNSAFYGQDEIVAVTFDNYPNVTSIGNGAFQQCSNLVLIRIPDNITEINVCTLSECGALKWTYMGNSLVTINPFAFYGTNLSSMDTIPSTIQTIGEQAFCNCNLSNTFYLPANNQLTSLGNYAFGLNSSLSSLVIKNTITSIGNNAFRECDNLTIYTNAASKLTGWSSSWNYSNRPVFWGCTLDSTNSYVVSFTKSNSNPANRTATNGINNPYRDGYNFDGWYTTSDYSGTQYTNVLDAPNGTLYAKWVKKSCVAEGSLITLADGTQVAVENLTGDEYLLVWNMLTGQFDVAPILFIDNDPTLTYEIIELTFSDGTIVKVIDEHAFFDMTLGEYVFLRSDAYQYIGHYFNKQSYDNNNNMIWTSVQLTNVTIYNEITTAWSPVTYSYLCYYVNGMLSMPGATEGFINIFEVDTTNMQYDATLMASDIATYGLYTYEEFNAIISIPELVFNAFNGQYLKVSIGKGLITLNQIALLLERYSIFFV